MLPEKHAIVHAKIDSTIIHWTSICNAAHWARNVLNSIFVQIAQTIRSSWWHYNFLRHCYGKPEGIYQRDGVSIRKLGTIELHLKVSEVLPIQIWDSIWMCMSRMAFHFYSSSIVVHYYSSLVQTSKGTTIMHFNNFYGRVKVSDVLPFLQIWDS